jgi:cell wall-associated NlpC family hydrolase
MLPGDLLFFGKDPGRITHVGMVLPDGTFLHAHGQVIINSLDTSHPRYAPALAASWRLSRDPLAD